LNKGFDRVEKPAVRGLPRPRCAQFLHDLGLPLPGHLPIACKGCHFALVAEILASGFPFFRIAGELLAVFRAVFRHGLAIPFRVRITVGLLQLT